MPPETLETIDYEASLGQDEEELDIGDSFEGSDAPPADPPQEQPPRLPANLKGTSQMSSMSLRRAAEAASAKIDHFFSSITERGDADHFDAVELENRAVELAQRNVELKKQLEYERRASNDSDRESSGPMHSTDADQFRADFKRALEKAVGMCLAGEARSFSLANRRPNVVKAGQPQGSRVSLLMDSGRGLHLGEIADTYRERLPDISQGVVSHDEMARFDSAMATTDAGAPLGIIYEDYAEEDRAFFGSLTNPEITDVWYRMDRLDGAGADLKDVDLPLRNKRLTAGQATENADMTEDDSLYDEVVFSANSVDLARNISNKYRQKTQIFNFMAQEMIPTLQAVERKCENLLLLGDGSRTTSGREGQPKGYWTALDALTGNDVAITRSTANTRAGFKGKVEDIEDTINKIDVGYRGYGSLSLVMHPDIWGYLSSLRSDQLREMAPFMERVSTDTRNFMLGIMGHFDGYVRILLHPDANNVLNAANKIAWSLGPTKAYRYVTTDLIYVFDESVNRKKRGQYFAVYRYDDGDLGWTSIGAPVGILAQTS